MGDFQLRINDTNHEIQLPDDQIARLLLVNEDNEVSQGFKDPLYGQGLTDRIHSKMTRQCGRRNGFVSSVALS